MDRDDYNTDISYSSDDSCSLRETTNSLPQSAIIYNELTRSQIEKIIGMKPLDIS